jgi:hypothetical protein
VAQQFDQYLKRQNFCFELFRSLCKKEILRLVLTAETVEFRRQPSWEVVFRRQTSSQTGLIAEQRRYILQIIAV